MREVKFKFWDSKNKIMVYFNPLILVNDELLMQYLANLMVERPQDLRQYTGLKDKNGVEIYVGDVLKDDCEEILEVKFGKLPLNKSGDCVCTYRAFYAKSYGRLGSAPYYECQSIGEWMEIIGNIYEHPELISK